MTAFEYPRDMASPLTWNDRAAVMLASGSLGAVSLGAVTGMTAEGPTLCPFRVITGLPCPFCGVTRSLFALGRGDLESSVQFSPLGGIVAVAAVLLLVLVAVAVVRERPLRWPRPLVAGGVVLIATSWVFQLLGAV
jgi:hypothetical protein